MRREVGICRRKDFVVLGWIPGREPIFLSLKLKNTELYFSKIVVLITDCEIDNKLMPVYVYALIGKCLHLLQTKVFISALSRDQYNIRQHVSLKKIIKKRF